MARCPNCKAEIKKPKKEWKYAQFTVHVYSCNCGTEFRDYMKDGKPSFTLKRRGGKRFVRA